jgi:hypothetical protein
MARRKVAVSKEMSAEQIAYYVRDLMNSSSKIEETLGEAMWEAIYAARDRMGACIRTLSGFNGKSEEMDQVIQSIIAKLRGEA